MFAVKQSDGFCVGIFWLKSDAESFVAIQHIPELYRIEELTGVMADNAANALRQFHK